MNVATTWSTINSKYCIKLKQNKHNIRSSNRTEHCCSQYYLRAGKCDGCRFGSHSGKCLYWSYLNSIRLYVKIFFLLEGDPHNYLTYFKRGTVYYALGKAKFALQDFTKVSSTNIYLYLNTFNTQKLWYQITIINIQFHKKKVVVVV